MSQNRQGYSYLLSQFPFRKFLFFYISIIRPMKNSDRNKQQQSRKLMSIVYKQMNIFLFHRDLRLIDNTALISQLKKHKHVTPIFIFTPVQIDPKKNSYFSNNSVQFMVQCLKQLQNSIQQLGGRFYFFYGPNVEVLKAIHQRETIASIYYNSDYTPFAKSRDIQIYQWAKTENIQIGTEQDYVLYPLLKGQTRSPKSDRPYQIFTPFKNYCLAKLKVREPDSFKYLPSHFQKNQNLQNLTYSFKSQQTTTLYETNVNLKVRGGRKNALQILSNIDDHKDYNKQRNLPAIPTTGLSAYLHFTPVSIREVYKVVITKLGLENNIANELHWRDFYVNITHYFPRVLISKQNSFQPKFDKIQWNYNQKHLEAWKQGKTGFPIVDAAMRELNFTGFMHNRGRMIVASFLAKDLFLDWHQGQRYFATKLVDYSPMQNSGGWQWTVGNGTDAQPFFRIFNPWTQQANYDAQCIYIKRWIPELKAVPNDGIHRWYEVCQMHRSKGVDYPAPIIEHEQARKSTLEIYSNYFKGQKNSA